MLRSSLRSCLLVALIVGLMSCGPSETHDAPRVIAGPTTDSQQSPASAKGVTSTNRGVNGLSATTSSDTVPAEEESRFNADCKKRLNEARTGEEKKAALRWCEENRPRADGPGVVTYGEQLNFEAAKSWWPYRPIFESREAESSGLTGIWVAYSPRQRGSQGSPHNEVSSLKRFYFPPSIDPGRDSSWDILEAGGLIIETHFYPPGEEVPFTDESEVPEQEVVIVRDRAARVIELYLERGSNVNVRWIRWEEAQPNGGHVQYVIGTHPKKYTRERSIELVNLFVEHLD